MHYPGQGQPLPESMQMDGEWILRGKLFLFHSDDKPLTSNQPCEIRVANTPDGQRPRGLEIGYVAKSLGVSIDELQRMNRYGEISVRLVAATAAGDRSHLFLTTPQKTVDIELEGSHSVATS
ncbi:MAG: hypothetical protein HY243_03170 [Proteobacteria bacterium]|nr:hypothetical protein [Pseudomonadota bacterium]